MADVSELKFNVDSSGVELATENLKKLEAIIKQLRVLGVIVKADLDITADSQA